MLDHLSIQCADVERSARFYDLLLAALGGERILEDDGPVFGFGVADAGLLAGAPCHRRRLPGSAHRVRRAGPSGGRCLLPAAVDAGAEALHQPKAWPQYHANYHGAFVRDPDGNNVEAVCHSPQ